MDSLDCLRCADGMLLDGFIEKRFAWDQNRGDKFNVPAPYQEPWIGFVHNPPDIPAWFNTNQQAPMDILRTPCWRQSMRSCLGLFTLSTYLREWLAPRVPVPVCSLLPPTETPENKFSVDKYLSNDDKQVLQVGWWLRKFHSLYRLRLTRLNKVLLNLGDPWTEAVRCKELEFVRDHRELSSVRIAAYLRNDEYDEILSKNIVFLDLYDSSYNNAIVECIVRGTPVLVNPLPAVTEYLGCDYPFYFESLEEAAYKAENEVLVTAAHEYLEAHSLRKKLTREHFLQSFVESEVYQNSPLPPSQTRVISARKFQESQSQVNSSSPVPQDSDVARQPAEEGLARELTQEWNRALAGDGQARANWQVIEGGQWSWQPDGVCVGACGSEWSAYQYSRCDPQALRSLRNFVIEVTISGSARAAGLSFGPYKDFLVELDPRTGRRHLQLEVDTVADIWAFRVDGQLANRCWWDSSVRNTADLAGGHVTFKARGADCVLFQTLAIHTFLRSCQLSVITTCCRFAQRLRISLRNWVHQSIRSGAHEILVVNPDSPDGTHELLAAVSGSYPNMRIREVPVASTLASDKGAMINRALEVSRGQWIWLAHADCLFPPASAATVLAEIAGRKQRVFYGERRHLSAAQTAALLAGRLDGLSEFESLVRDLPPRPSDNAPWGYTQIVDREVLECVRYREELNGFADSDGQFVEDCESCGIVSEPVAGLFCLHLDHPIAGYGTNIFL